MAATYWDHVFKSTVEGFLILKTSPLDMIGV